MPGPVTGVIQSGNYVISNVDSNNHATLKDANMGTPITATKGGPGVHFRETVVRWNLFGMTPRTNITLSSSGPSSGSATTSIPSGHSSTPIMPKSAPAQTKATWLWQGPMNTNGSSRKPVKRVNICEPSHLCLISLPVTNSMRQHFSTFRWYPLLELCKRRSWYGCESQSMIILLFEQTSDQP